MGICIPTGMSVKRRGSVGAPVLGGKEGEAMLKIKLGRKTVVLGSTLQYFRGWYLKRGPFRTWRLYLGRVSVGVELSRWL